MKKVIVCVNARTNPALASCARRGGREIAARLTQATAGMNLEVVIEPFHCLGHCEEGPNIRLAPDGPFLKRVDINRIEDLLPLIRDFVAGEKN